MSDLISRKALLTEIRKRCGMWRKTAEIFCEVIEKQPTVEAVPVVHGEWIPCSERMPEKYGEYLCCDKYGEFIIGYPTERVSEESFYVETEHEIMNDCIAWMPLPEPYKADMRKKV